MFRFFPWKFLLNRAAKKYGFLDPITFLARLRSFAQPSEVQEPIELLRAGMVFHARGLLNTKAIQHNLDWVWPYWTVRQFNPGDPSFIPRAFSFSHVNLTHRNWTAVGLPDIPLYPIVDPRGLVTPLQDGWSIDCWFYGRDGKTVFPSMVEQVDQRLIDDDNRSVITRCRGEGVCLDTAVHLERLGKQVVVSLTATVTASPSGGWLVVALRPYNPEGVQFIESVEGDGRNRGWLVNKAQKVEFSEPADKLLFANYRDGDISHHLEDEQSVQQVESRIGMASAAAFFAVGEHGHEKKVRVQVPLARPVSTLKAAPCSGWREAVAPSARLVIPDSKMQFLYDTAIRTLIHLAADSIVPGPYTYNRFWFRDACLMLHPMLAVGLKEISWRQIDHFAQLQDRNGFFHSQEGEWDANGQVLWLYNRYRQLYGGEVPQPWLDAISRGAEWINRKRISSPDVKYHGLLPPGFSAEHFGPNDYYYWDDFWAVAGLEAAAQVMEDADVSHKASKYRRFAAEMRQCIFRSIKRVMEERQLNAIPTSPNRRMDSGAIGALAVDYPLQLVEPGDQRVMATADFLMDNCLHRGCFFQDMIHSGINIYMTLMLAQSYLRAGDTRFYHLLSGVVDLASPTGQWPEAIHPITGGGCMGDGQHGWAAAEFVMLLRNMFVAEEEGKIIIGRGIRPEWLEDGQMISFGPTRTSCGSFTVEVINKELWVEFSGLGRELPDIRVEIPDYVAVSLRPPAYRCRLEPVSQKYKCPGVKQ